MNISSINPVGLQPIQNSFQKPAPSKNSFTDVLQGYLQNVNQTVKQAEDLSTKVATGEVDNIHDVTIASQKATLALELTVTIRDKAIESYQEIMRMQV
jgi:flagellar hook-basal body complex protein FliE